MIIDLILDRKDWEEEGYNTYDAKQFYDNVVAYGEIGFEIARALDGGTEENVKKALCDYVINNEYNPKICDYINSVKWLPE